MQREVRLWLRGSCSSEESLSAQWWSLVLLHELYPYGAKGGEMSLQGGKAEMFLRTISHSKIWLTLVFQQNEFWLCTGKKKQTKILCECLGTNLLILWKLLVRCAVKRRISRDSGLLLRNQSRIMHLFLTALSHAPALGACSDEWSAHHLLMGSQRWCTSSLWGTCYFRYLEAHYACFLVWFFGGRQSSDLLICLNYFIAATKQQALD